MKHPAMFNPLLSTSCLRGIFALALLALSSLSGRAALIINIYESGSDVIADVSGSVVYMDTGTSVPETLYTAIVPATDTLSFAPLGGTGSYLRHGISGYPNPTFGNGGPSLATSVSGDTDLLLTTSFLFLPDNYVLGTPISVTATFADTTISTMGMNPGTYYYTWDNGLNVDGATLNIAGGPAAVPEPGTWAAAAMLLGGAGFIRWRKRAKSA